MLAEKSRQKLGQTELFSASLMVLVLLGVGAATILLYIGLLFWIQAIRLSFVELPLKEMRREPG
jgi:hypothetical protein